MDKANVERLRILLKGHEEILEAKRIHPEAVQRQNEGFRESFNAVVRSTILPVLEEIKDLMVGKVESAAIFHRLTAAGLKVKLDRWEDFERSLLFCGDPGSRMIRITHEGVGFGLLSKKVDLAQITPALVEEEAMKFLKRVFGDEQLRRPIPVGPPPRRRPVSTYDFAADPELVRV
ncbi:MAG TPA: hypothetical protein VFE33_18375 [Thermoanaerobaculia bacterium]|nr:hypothetical protein [Thermoanaerobaculia bacterium]